MLEFVDANDSEAENESALLCRTKPRNEETREESRDLAIVSASPSQCGTIKSSNEPLSAAGVWRPGVRARKPRSQLGISAMLLNFTRRRLRGLWPEQLNGLLRCSSRIYSMMKGKAS
jgi:hypothetical protein